MLRLRWVKMVFGGIMLAGVAVFTTDRLSTFEIRQLRSRIDELEREKAEMLLYAERLSDSRRVAQVNILEQARDAAGDPITVLRWQQIGPSGELGAPEVIQVKGTQVYFEAMVIKFEYDLIGRAVPEQAANVAMFRRAFGERQAPASGQPLDQTAPLADSTGGGEGSPQDRLWQQFREFVDDPQRGKRYGIRVAQYEAPSVPVRPGQVWEVSLDAAGGLNLRKLAEQPLKDQHPGTDAPALSRR